ncbi:MAG: hypothetical protein IPO30_01845 [Hyphomonadaceae bacterium]|nr:hypothetical protein [Hyphomonadaceae bacterium]
MLWARFVGFDLFCRGDPAPFNQGDMGLAFAAREGVAGSGQALFLGCDHGEEILPPGDQLGKNGRSARVRHAHLRSNAEQDYPRR